MASKSSDSKVHSTILKQINYFVRRHPFIQKSLIGYTTSERRSFERSIYDYARCLRVSHAGAKQEVLKGRAFCGETEYNSDDSALGDEIDDSAKALVLLSAIATDKTTGFTEAEQDAPEVPVSSKNERKCKKMRDRTKALAQASSAEDSSSVIPSKGEASLDLVHKDMQAVGKRKLAETESKPSANIPELPLAKVVYKRLKRSKTTGLASKHFKQSRVDSSSADPNPVSFETPLQPESEIESEQKNQLAVGTDLPTMGDILTIGGNEMNKGRKEKDEANSGTSEDFTRTMGSAPLGEISAINDPSNMGNKAMSLPNIAKSSKRKAKIHRRKEARKIQEQEEDDKGRIETNTKATELPQNAEHELNALPRHRAQSSAADCSLDIIGKEGSLMDTAYNEKDKKGRKKKRKPESESEASPSNRANGRFEPAVIASTSATAISVPGTMQMPGLTERNTSEQITAVKKASNEPGNHLEYPSGVQQEDATIPRTNETFTMDAKKGRAEKRKQRAISASNLKEEDSNPTLTRILRSDHVSVTAADEEVSKIGVADAQEIRIPSTDVNAEVLNTPSIMDLSFVMHPSGLSSPLSSLSSSPDPPLPDLRLSDIAGPSPERRKSTTKASSYFPQRLVEKLSCIPFPPLCATSFGLVQERLCHDPFRLLIAVLFLNKTRGTVAMPTCYQVFARYPTPGHLAIAKHHDVRKMIQHLGFGSRRTERIIKLAQTWMHNPPSYGQRYRKLNYPNKGDGKDIKARAGPVPDDDPRVAWEVGHLPGLGAYAIDSWRIFCRDELRGLPHGIPELLSPEVIEVELSKEWTRVLPTDKELRAYLRWRWLRLGWIWDPLTGEKRRLDASTYTSFKNGGVNYEGNGINYILGEQILLDPRQSLTSNPGCVAALNPARLTELAVKAKEVTADKIQKTPRAGAAQKLKDLITTPSSHLIQDFQSGINTTLGQAPNDSDSLQIEVDVPAVNSELDTI